jgi:uncharacterized membrane protein (UPF0127 family)
MIKRHLKVEIAETPERLRTGLMFRRSLPENDGMLFRFRHPQNLKFWGLNTYIPLSIAFVSPDHKIQKITYISPMSTVAVDSSVDCNMAIEANWDFFTKNGVTEGHRVKFVDGEDGATYVAFEE